MRSKWIRGIATALLLSCMALSGGCAGLIVGTAGGGAAVAYVKGELRATKDAPIGSVYGATLRALDEMNIRVSKKRQDATSAQITGELANDDDLEIWFERTSDDSTRLGIRIGTFGDEEKSRLILERIDEQLKQGG